MMGSGASIAPSTKSPGLGGPPPPAGKARKRATPVATTPVSRKRKPPASPDATSRSKVSSQAGRRKYGGNLGPSRPAGRDGRAAASTGESSETGETKATSDLHWHRQRQGLPASRWLMSSAVPAGCEPEVTPRQQPHGIGQSPATTNTFDFPAQALPWNMSDESAWQGDNSGIDGHGIDHPDDHEKTNKEDVGFVVASGAGRDHGFAGRTGRLKVGPGPPLATPATPMSTSRKERLEVSAWSDSITQSLQTEDAHSKTAPKRSAVLPAETEFDNVSSSFLDQTLAGAPPAAPSHLLTALSDHHQNAWKTGPTFTAKETGKEESAWPHVDKSSSFYPDAWDLLGRHLDFGPVQQEHRLGRLHSTFQAPGFSPHRSPHCGAADSEKVASAGQLHLPDDRSLHLERVQLPASTPLGPAEPELPPEPSNHHVWPIQHEHGAATSITTAATASTVAATSDTGTRVAWDDDHEVARVDTWGCGCRHPMALVPGGSAVQSQTQSQEDPMFAVNSHTATADTSYHIGGLVSASLASYYSTLHSPDSDQGTHPPMESQSFPVHSTPAYLNTKPQHHLQGFSGDGTSELTPSGSIPLGSLHQGCFLPVQQDSSGQGPWTYEPEPNPPINLSPWDISLYPIGQSFVPSHFSNLLDHTAHTSSGTMTQITPCNLPLRRHQAFLQAPVAVSPHHTLQSLQPIAPVVDPVPVEHHISHIAAVQQSGPSAGTGPIPRSGQESVLAGDISGPTAETNPDVTSRGHRSEARESQKPLMSIQLAVEHTELHQRNITEAEGEPVASSTSRRPRPRSSFDSEARRETANTRRMKACVRCRTQRIRCKPNSEDPYGPCATCIEVDVTSRKTTRPVHCIRYKMTNFVLNRPSGSLDLTQRWDGSRVSETRDWDGTVVVEIDMMQDVCPDGAPIPLRVRKFRPRTGDQVNRLWFDRSSNRSKEDKLEPYSLANVSDTINNFRDYIRKHAEAAVAKYARKSSHNNTDPTKLFEAHYLEALSHYYSPNLPGVEREMLFNVFCLWFATQLTLRSSWLCGDNGKNTLATAVPSHGDIRTSHTPRMVVAQFDRISPLHILRPLRTIVLKELELLTRSTNKECFFTVYITIFFLLHLVSLTCEDRFNYARRKNLYCDYDMPQFIEELQRGAMALLCYWDYYKGCETILQDGYLEQCNLTVSQQTLLIRGSREVERLQRSGDIEPTNYQSAFFWVGQMLERNWSPKPIWSAPHYDGP